MQRGNVYIGCSKGTDYTDCALCLDYLFNPKSNHASYASYDNNYYCYDNYMHGQHWTDNNHNVEYIFCKLTNTYAKKLEFNDWGHCYDYFYVKFNKILKP